MSQGYIYIIEDEPNIYKIGFSKFFPTHRQKQISGNYHKDFKLVAFHESDMALLEEKKIHDKLSQFKIKGEWFKISLNEIKSIIDIKFIEGFELEEIINERKMRPKNKRKKRDFITIMARFPQELLDRTNEKIKDRIGLSRNAWILESIQEKLKSNK